MGKTGFQVSELVENRYRVLSILGTGGMGTVYRVADETRDGEVLALKTLTLDTSVSKFVEGFKREFRILAQLRHPNLVSVYDYGITVTGDLYFTMEYVEGQNLESYVQQLGTVVTIPLMVQICRALAYIHARGVIHGDLKPANVLVVGVRVKVMDFGVAREARSAEVSRYWSGTLGYVAPEAHLQRPVDRRADLYGLGAVWYRLLVGEPPMFMPGHERLAHLTLVEALEAQEEVPETIGAVITRLMATSPDDRYVSANAVITAINETTGSSYALETRETAASYALQGRFVGREGEMEALQAAWQRARDTGGEMVLVGGEEGVGKSRLLQEFTVQVAQEGARVTVGQCVEAGSTPYHPWREVLRVLVRYVESADTTAMKLLGPVLATLLPELRERAYMAGIAPPPDLDPQAARLGLNVTVVRLLRAAAAVRPTVVVVEDAHWADESTLELLGFLARSSNPAGLLVCAAYRDDELDPEHPLALLAEDGVKRLRLHNLPPEATTDLVRSMLGLEQLPQALTQRAQQTTDGNAFFVQELVRSLAEDNLVLQRTERGWRVDEAALLEVTLPDTIRQVVLRRLKRLALAEREALQWAAVVGPVFWDGAMVAQTGEVAREDVWAVLRTLRDKGLILERETPAFVGTREYTFQHFVLREVTYESILEEELPGHHGRVAEWLVEHSGERAGEYTGMIAEHLELAGRFERALGYSIEAARQAQAAYANEAAMSWYSRTLEMLNRLGPRKASQFQSLRLSAHQFLGEVLALMGRYDEALEHYASARTLIEAEAPSSEQAGYLVDLCRQTAEVHEKRSEYDLAFEWLEEGLSYLDEDEPTIEAARIYHVGMWLYHRQGKGDKAITWCQRSLDIASQIKTREGQQAMGRAYDLLGIIYLRRGDFSRSVQFSRESVQVYQQLDDIVGQAKAYNNLANAYFEQGDWARASDAYHKSLAMIQEIGDVYGQGLIASNLAEVHRNRGEWSQAASLYAESIAIWKQIGAAWHEAVTLSNLAQVHTYQENWSEAHACLSNSQTIFAEVGSENLLSELERCWGEFYLRTGELDQALAHTLRSIELAVGQGNPLEEGESRRLLGRVHLARGERETAEAALRQSLQILTDLNSEYEAAKTKLSLARLATEIGPTDEARAHLTQATKIFEKLGAQADLAEARDLGGEL